MTRATTTAIIDPLEEVVREEAALLERRNAVGHMRSAQVGIPAEIYNRRAEVLRRLQRENVSRGLQEDQEAEGSSSA